MAQASAGVIGGAMGSDTTSSARRSVMGNDR